jgi:hypothetical protein
MDVGSLADLLRETSERHGSFEAVAPAHDWWDWYAAYMNARSEGISPDDASAAAGRYMEKVKHIVASGAGGSPNRGGMRSESEASSRS